MRRARLTAGIVLTTLGMGVGAVVAPLAGAPDAAAATRADPNTPTPVPSGVNAAALPGATVFGSTAADTPVTVSFILKEQNLRWLEAQVEAGARTTCRSASSRPSTASPCPTSTR